VRPTANPRTPVQFRAWPPNPRIVPSIFSISTTAIISRTKRISAHAKNAWGAHGLKETEASVANKVSRGTFPATFFIAARVAIGCEAVKLEDI
jgi:hypothetical protein